MRAIRDYCWWSTFAILLLTFAHASRGDEGPFPRPASDAITKAEAKVREVYKGDLAKANKPTEKAALAGELLKAADGVGPDDASRLVLITMAKDLAVDANDAHLAMKAVTALVRRFQPDGPTDAKEQIERGNAPWREAETAPAEKRLGLQIQAAEWYLRAKPAATGLDETLIAKRLAELGETKLPTDKKPLPAGNKQSVPTGWVKIVNRKTGLAVWPRSLLQIEAAGDHYKIRWRDRYLGPVGRKPPLLRHMPNSGSRAILWDIEPLGDGYWSITNCASGKCLEDPWKSKKPPAPEEHSHQLRQSEFHAGDPIQQWRLQRVTPEEVATKAAIKESPNEPDTASDVSPETPPSDTEYHLLNCGNLSVGDTGRIEIFEIVRIIDDQSCVALPYEIVQHDTRDSYGMQTHISFSHEPLLPVLLKGWPTAGKVTGSKEQFNKSVFRVKGTQDMKNKIGETIRVHVLEAVRVVPK